MAATADFSWVQRMNDSTLNQYVDAGKIYMTTNETCPPFVRKWIQLAAQDGPRFHLGCAGWENLNIMVARRSEYGLIFDFNPSNTIFMTATLHVIRQCPDRIQFQTEMAKYLTPDENGNTSQIAPTLKLDLKTPAIFWRLRHQMISQPLTSIQEMTWSASLSESWLYSDATYTWIRNLALRNRIYAVTQSMTNVAAFEWCKSELDRHRIVVDTIYLSNIGVFIPLEERELMIRAVRAMASPTTLIIHCPPKSSPTYPGELISNPLEQHLNSGAELFGMTDDLSPSGSKLFIWWSSYGPNSISLPV